MDKEGLHQDAPYQASQYSSVPVRPVVRAARRAHVRRSVLVNVVRCTRHGSSLWGRARWVLAQAHLLREPLRVRLVQVRGLEHPRVDLVKDMFPVV